MINGLYSGASALDIFSRQQELIASNLANLNTPGHKRQLFSIQEQSVDPGNRQAARPGASVSQFATDFSQGRHEPTGRALDIAIKGDGFFVYQGQTEQLYSRNGVLFRDEQGQLVNGDGLTIVGDGGPIQIPQDVSDHDLMIDPSGSISANGAEFGKLSVVTFNNNQLLKSDSQTYFRAGTAIATPSQDVTIAQGTRELSNAHPVTELVSMIIGSRHFESAQRAIRTISETLQQAARS
jgi:flagellar basal body rod protein FlgG